MGGSVLLALALAIAHLLSAVSAQQCGSEANDQLCDNNLCCSRWGYCGSTSDYCCEGCQSQCNCPPPPPPSPPPPPPSPPPPYVPPPPPSDLELLFTEAMFEQMLMHRNDLACPARGFYTYDAFIEATKTFPGFASTGDDETKRREIAAFFGQTSHETTGGWDGAPDGRHAWGYCFKEETVCGEEYCVPHPDWPCVPGKQYCGRGPIQLSYNYNYGPAGRDLGLPLLENPDLVAQDPVVAFQTALWFWMTPQPPKPSCHEVMTGQWTPSSNDVAANRLPGYGATTNIINGGVECGHGTDDRETDRIGFFQRYCTNIPGLSPIDPGDNVSCGNQTPFGWGLYLQAM